MRYSHVLHLTQIYKHNLVLFVEKNLSHFFRKVLTTEAKRGLEK